MPYLKEIEVHTMPNDKFAVVGTNIAEKATMIWNVADMLRGPFKPHEYGLVILPMTVVKRFHDCLLPTHDAVLETYEKVRHFAVKDGFLTKASGYQFYNISKFTFDSLLTDPENIEANFRDYLAGFSTNVQDVLSKFDFDTVIRRMVESNTLYLVIREFNSPKGYLGPDRITAVDCGYIFEDLVRRFSESFGCTTWPWAPARCSPAWRSASGSSTRRSASPASGRSSTPPPSPLPRRT